MVTTITEALAAIKTTQARLAKKRLAILPYITRDARLIDPLTKEGGSEAYIASERQAISDLEQRVVRLRTAIQAANIATQLTIGTVTMSVAEWLTWRREIAQDSNTFLVQMFNLITTQRSQERKRNALNTATTDATESNTVVCLSEKALTSDIETMQQVLGELDGKLSLLNATTTVTVPD